MKQFIQLSNEDIDTALSHALREEVRRCNKHITDMQARIEKLEKVKDAAQKLVNYLRGVAHGTWVVEELEAALRDVT